jgi:hypothetical protein
LSRLKNYQKSLILAVILAILAFFWIWLYQGIGANGYWAALIAFAVFIASGSVAPKLPWMALGSVIGIILGFLSFALANLIFPPYAALSAAFAGAIFLLIAALIGIPKMRDIFPMTVVGWACFIAAIARFDYLFSSQPIWANTKALATVSGVFLSLMVGLLAGALLATPLMAAMSQKQPATGQPE